MYSQYHPINILKKHKGNLSKLLSHIISRDELYKEEIDPLYNAITNTDLVNAGIEIEESKKKILKGILDNLNDLRRVWHYKVNSDEFKFVVTLIMDIEIKILQKAQKKAQNRIETLKLKVKPFAFFRGPQAYQNYKDYQKDKEELKSERHKLKVEEWKVKLDQRFEESRNEPLDEVARKIGSKYIEEEIKNNNYRTNFRYKREKDGQVRSIGEIADRLSSSKDINYGDQDKYTDWRILLKIEINEVKTLLDKDQKLTKEDKKALKEIYKDLKEEKDKSKKYFNPSNDKYIQNWREARSAPPQSTVEAISTMTNQSNLSTSSV